MNETGVVINNKAAVKVRQPIVKNVGKEDDILLDERHFVFRAGHTADLLTRQPILMNDADLVEYYRVGGRDDEYCRIDIVKLAQHPEMQRTETVKSVLNNMVSEFHQVGFTGYLQLANSYISNRKSHKDIEELITIARNNYRKWATQARTAKRFLGLLEQNSAVDLTSIPETDSLRQRLEGIFWKTNGDGSPMLDEAEKRIPYVLEDEIAIALQNNSHK